MRLVTLDSREVGGRPGVWLPSGEVLDRLAAGDAVDPSEYYFRTHLRFSTGAERFAHLNRILGIAVGQRHATGVLLTAYAVP